MSQTDLKKPPWQEQHRPQNGPGKIVPENIWNHWKNRRTEILSTAVTWSTVRWRGPCMQQDHGKNALFKIIRHAGVMLKHLTPRKFINCGTALTELKLRRTRLMSRPYIARINTYPFCNLSCKGCMGSGRQHTNMSHHIMTTTEYKTIIDNIGNNLLFVILYDEGEPLLNPDRK